VDPHVAALQLLRVTASEIATPLCCLLAITLNLIAIISAMKKFIIASLVFSCLQFSSVKAEEGKCCPPNPAMRQVTVSGTATLKSAPDMASVSLSIISRHKDFKLCSDDNTRIAKEVLTAVRSLGIPEKNIKMRNLNINEEFEYDGVKQKNIKKGFIANRAFSVEIKKADLSFGDTLTDKVAQVVNAVVQNGSNQLQNVSYGLEDPRKLSNQALSDAVADAKSRAELMLSPLAATLGAVQSINENTYRPYPMVKSFARMDMMVAEGASSSMPSPESFSEGDIEVTSNVNVTFEIK